MLHPVPTPPPSGLARRAAPLYGIEPDTLTRLAAFESEVLHAPTTQGEVILKIIDVTHRTPDQVRAEIDWLRALLEQGLAVAQPLPARTGRWLEPIMIDDAPVATAVAYRKSRGAHRSYDAWSDDHAHQLGRLLGHLQRHTRRWTPPGPLRPDWREAHVLDRAATAFPSDPAMQDAVARLLPHANDVTHRLTDTGLMHADAHASNVLIDDRGTLTLIDFDDAVRGPYLHDLAVALYYPVATQPDQDPGTMAERFLAPFLGGFDAIAPRPQGGSEDVATLLALRAAELAIAVRLTVPQHQWTKHLHAAAIRLRDRTVAARELVPPSVLRRYFD